MAKDARTKALEKKGFSVRDYHTGKDVLGKKFKSKDEAYNASKEHLRRMKESGEVHNNLHYFSKD